MLLLLLGVPLYLWYALNGKTNPDTAAHLHFFVTPLMYSLLVILTLGGTATVLWILRGSNDRLEDDAAKPRASG